MIQLGDKVKDTVTGFKGIAVAITQWLNGCDRVTVQPQGLKKDGSVYDTYCFDVTQIEYCGRAKVKTGERDTGGPRPSPAKQPGIAAHSRPTSTPGHTR